MGHSEDLKLPLSPADHMACMADPFLNDDAIDAIKREQLDDCSDLHDFIKGVLEGDLDAKDRYVSIILIKATRLAYAMARGDVF